MSKKLGHDKFCKLCDCGRAFNSRGECRDCLELAASRSGRHAHESIPLGTVAGGNLVQFGANDVSFRRKVKTKTNPIIKG